MENPPSKQDKIEPSWREKAGVKIAAVATVLLATLAVYWQVRGFDFINIDDPELVYQNERVQDGLTWATIKWAFTESHLQANWDPMTCLSHAAVSEFFGMDSGAHHLANVAIHLANILLLLAVLVRLTGAFWKSLAVTALFALHPLQVEVVAFVSERKGVLSSFFFLAGIFAYTAHVRRKSIAGFALVAVCYVLGLMSKATIMTFPFLLLLLDIWPLKRIGVDRCSADAEADNFRTQFMEWFRQLIPLAKEKALLFVLSFSWIFIAYMAQSQTDAAGAGGPDFISRAGNALVSYARYLSNLIAPMDLGAFYPHPGRWPVPAILGAAALLIGVSIWVTGKIHRFPEWAVGWFWFLGVLVPNIQIIQIGNHAMADRYAYLPQIGFWILVVWGLTEASSRLARNGLRFMIAICIAASIGFAFKTRSQAALWKDSETLFRHTNRIAPGNLVALNALGATLKEQQRFEEAEDCYREALELKPNHFHSRFNYANLLFQTRRFPEAKLHYLEAVRLQPEHKAIHNNLANTLATLGEYEEAKSSYSEAIRLNPNDPLPYLNLGKVALLLNQPKEAANYIQKAIQLQPGNAEAHFRLGRALALSGEPQFAVVAFGEVLKLAPHRADAWTEIGNIALADGNLAAGIQHYQRAVEVQPTNHAVRRQLATLYANAGQHPLAAKAYAAVLESEPNDLESLNSLAFLLAASPNNDLRDGPAAVQLAGRARQMTNGKDRRVLDTLAAALAETGKFEDAVSVAEEAIRLAKSQGDGAFADRVSSRLELYRSQKPFRLPQSQRNQP